MASRFVVRVLHTRALATFVATALLGGLAAGCQADASAPDAASDLSTGAPTDGLGNGPTDGLADAAVDAIMNPPECPAMLPSNGGGVNHCGETDLTCRYPGWTCNCRDGRPGHPGWWYCNPDECNTAANGQACATVGLRCMIRFEGDCVCGVGNRWMCSGGVPDMAK